MRMLVADDGRIDRYLLERSLASWGHEPIPVEDGEAAWQVLQASEAPPLALLDWMMPGLTGVDVCKLAPQHARGTYIILVSGRDSKEDICPDCYKQHVELDLANLQRQIDAQK